MMLSDTLKDNYDYQKFTYSVFKYKGAWVFCSEFGASYMALENLTTRQMTMHKANLEPLANFSFSEHQTGYANLKTGPAFLTLRTTGGGTRGISHVNMGIPEPLVAQASLWNSIVHDTGFLKMLENNYPSKQDAWNAVTKNSHPQPRMAFHRNFMFVRNGINIVTLFYKSRAIGEMNIKQGFDTLELYPAFHHMERHIKEEGKFSNVLQTASQA